jgi:putative heme-binding domain-containing protein
LSHDDRFIRFAARIALEHQPVEEWQERALSETDPALALPALMALVRQQERHPALSNDIHDPPVPAYDDDEAPGTTRPQLKSQILASLGGIDWSALNYQQKLDLLRVYMLTFVRMGPPDDRTRQRLMHRLDAAFPARGRELNAELCQMLVYLQSPTVAIKTLPLLNSAPTQEEQIDYARSLRHLQTGWNLDLLRDYFAWFVRAATYRGGASFGLFVQHIKEDAMAHLSDEQKTALQDILEAVPESNEPALSAEPREFVQEWTMEELAPLVRDGLHDRNYRRGREMFAAAKCFACHRFDGEGGAVGPDLTALSGRFSPRDILESILDPGKTISDQYAAVQILMLDGRIITGRIVNLSGDSFQVNENMLAPNATVGVDRKQIDEMMPSKVSMMPKGLLDTLNQEEVLDLMAYLLSRGDPDSPMFAQGGAVEPPDGFRALFNGMDTSGWHGMPHFDPRKLAAMTDEERQAKIEEWTEDALQHWSVENGALVNDGHGAYMTTDEELGDVELLIDYRTVPLADSGIYLRATPQVQIWDYTEEGGKWDLGADKGSGGLWNNSAGAPGKDPAVLADRPFGEWNSFRIRQTGARTSVWLNGYQVVDHAIMENYWDRERPLLARGPIQLQTHGGEIRWRNIFVRDIDSTEANEILRYHSGDDFVSLFNGEDLTGWQGAVDEYEVVDGAIRCKPGHGGNLFTEEEYADFQVRLEFRLPPGGNNGLAIRFPGTGNPAYDGMCELQVLDTEHEKYAGLDPRQAHGSPYGMVPAARGYLRPTGQWNFQVVTVQGSRVRVELNGSVIVDADLAEVTEYKDNAAHPGKELKSGYFGFAGHNDPVEFRAIEIKRLDEGA